MNGYVQQRELESNKEQENLKMAKKYLPYIYADARAYKAEMENKDYNKAMSDAEQVVEKCFKANCKKEGKLSNSLQKGKYGHNIKKLKRACNISINVSDEDLDELSKAYIAGRYPEMNIQYKKEQAEKFGKIACEILDVTLEEFDVPNEELNRELGKNKGGSIEDFKSYNRLMQFNSSQNQ